MKNLLKWIGGLLSRKCEPHDTRKKRRYRAIWRTEDTGYYANETYVWAACEEDIPDILRKFFKMKKDEKFTEMRVFKVIPLDTSTRPSNVSKEKWREMLWEKNFIY